MYGYLSHIPSNTVIVRNMIQESGDHNFFIFREAASSLKKQISLPSCTIALVGESGHGKSSLLNALLDQNKILPTSAVKACTAVVIEVTNSTGQNYEADIEFFTKEVGISLALLLIFAYICVSNLGHNWLR